VFAPAALAGRAGKGPAAGQLASHTVSSPRAFRDRLAKATGERGPSHRGRRMHNQEVKMTQGTVKWFNGDKGYGPTNWSTTLPRWTPSRSASSSWPTSAAAAAMTSSRSPGSQPS